MRIAHYRREGDGSWRYRVLERGDAIALANGAQISVDAIYDGAFALEAD